MEESRAVFILEVKSVYWEACSGTVSEIYKKNCFSKSEHGPVVNDSRRLQNSDQAQQPVCSRGLD